MLPISDQAVPCQTVGQTLTCGSAKPALTIQAGTIAHGSSETETITLVLYGNVNNFVQFGSWGPDANTTNPAALTIKVAK